jgi:GT2 family glycosyltransferase
VAPLVLWRDEPNRVDSAGDGFALFGWAYKRGHGEPANRWENRPDERVFACCAAAAFYRASALRKVNGFDPHFGAYYEDVDLAFRLRWAGYECVFTPNSRVLHRVSATYNHARRELQRRVTRNSELVFWTNLPGRWLALAFAPHIVFNLVRLGWKLARGRAGPFVQGELDALRETPWIRDGRRQRSDLAHQAISRPSFPMSFAPIGSLIRQLRLGR